VSVEEVSMEVDYKDILSIELDEGVNISLGIKEMSPKKNDLSSLSPKSKFDTYSDF
jgi:hypothetical protein